MSSARMMTMLGRGAPAGRVAAMADGASAIQARKIQRKLRTEHHSFGALKSDPSTFHFEKKAMDHGKFIDGRSMPAPVASDIPHLSRGKNLLARRVHFEQPFGYFS